MASFLFFWLLFSVLIGALASSWGRSGLGYFIGSLIVSPLVTVLILIARGRADTESSSAAASSSSTGSVPFENQRKKCPDCAERVKLEARVCKHCEHEWTDEEVQRRLQAAVERSDKTLVHCSHADKVTSPDGVVCPECGNDFDNKDHTPASNYFQL